MLHWVILQMSGRKHLNQNIPGGSLYKYVVKSTIKTNRASSGNSVQQKKNAYVFVKILISVCPISYEMHTFLC